MGFINQLTTGYINPTWVCWEVTFYPTSSQFWVYAISETAIGEVLLFGLPHYLVIANTRVRCDAVSSHDLLVFYSDMGCHPVIQRSYRKSPFVIGKSSINGPFSMAMLNNQRVSVGNSLINGALGKSPRFLLWFYSSERSTFSPQSM